MISKVQTTKLNKLDYIKLTNLYTAKEIIVNEKATLKWKKKYLRSVYL